MGVPGLLSAVSFCCGRQWYPRADAGPQRVVGQPGVDDPGPGCQVAQRGVADREAAHADVVGVVALRWEDDGRVMRGRDDDPGADSEQRGDGCQVLVTMAGV